MPCVALPELSNAANRVNAILWDNGSLFDMSERVFSLQPLADAVDARASEAEPDDFARLGWLRLNLRDRSGAERAALAGLQIDPNNIHCQNVLNRIAQAV